MSRHARRSRARRPLPRLRDLNPLTWGRSRTRVATAAVAAVAGLTLAGSAVSWGLMSDSEPPGAAAAQPEPQILTPERSELSRSSQRKPVEVSVATEPVIVPAPKLEKLPPNQRPAAKAKRLRARTERALALPSASFRVATFNVLGAAHTAPGGNKKGYASGPTRMGWTVDLLNGAGVSVVGFQEFEPPQFDTLRRIAPGWSVYPGLSLGRPAVSDSIAWRSDTWALVEGHTISIPYFHGQPQPMPYILLKHLATGRQVWFANFHNPADARGPAGKWRGIATAKEGDLAASLGADGTPVIVTGDMNDKTEFYCPFTARSGMKASNGGVPGSPCQPPGDLAIDWILGSAAVSFSDHHRVDGGIVDRTSDHPFVWAQATLSSGG